jgi:hypothetical protein
MSTYRGQCGECYCRAGQSLFKNLLFTLCALIVSDLPVRSMRWRFYEKSVMACAASRWMVFGGVGVDVLADRTPCLPGLRMSPDPHQSTDSGGAGQYPVPRVLCGPSGVADVSGVRLFWSRLARHSTLALGALSRRWRSAGTGWRGRRCLRRHLHRRTAMFGG